METVKEFLDHFNGAPISFEEVVHVLMNIKDDDELVKLASEYHDAIEALEQKLDDIGFEFG